LYDGAAFLVEVVSEKKRELNAVIREVRTIEPLPYPRIRVALAIPRFNVLEGVLEKLVEMGVESVQPLYSDNSFIKTATDTWASKESRFEKIIQSATQQCGRGEKMRLETPQKLADFLGALAQTTDPNVDGGINQNGGVAGLFAYEIGKVPIRDLGVAMSAKRPKAVWIFVGGEGGFSREEAAAFERAGLSPATLGRQVLRVETACVALVSVLKYELDLMR
jgi:16S rRNA (uracil1498-N3)-methyltransferase